VWFPVVRAARYLGVSPWDLYEQPWYWTLRALNAQDAEARLEARASSMG